MTDTVYRDIHTTFGTDSVYYRVGVRNLSGVSGLQYGKTAILPVSPETATTSFSSSLYHLKKDKEVTACSINDSLKVTFQFSNPSRNFTSLDVGNGLISKHFDEPVSSYSDSLFMFITVDTVVKVVATDDHGKEWDELIAIQVVEDKPVIVSVDSTVSLNVLDTIRAVVSDEYGEIVKYEWDLDGDGVFEVETAVPEVEVQGGSLIVDREIQLRVWDDDNIVESGYVLSKIVLSWAKVGELPVNFLNTSTQYTYFTFRDKLYRRHRTIEEDVFWVSDDGISWNITGDLSSLAGDLTPHFVVFNDKVWMTTYKFDNNTFMYKAFLWSSGDLTNWTKEFTSAGLRTPGQYMFFSTLSANGKLYSNIIDSTTMIYGGDTHGLPLMSSDDGMNWTYENEKESYVFLKRDHELYAQSETNYSRIAYDGKRMNFINYNSTFKELTDDEVLLPERVGMESLNSFNYSYYSNHIIMSLNNNLYIFNDSDLSFTFVGQIPNSEETQYNGLIYFKNELFLYSQNGTIFKLQ